MNTEFDQLIEGYAELNRCYVERDRQLQALNRAINVAAHTPIFSFDLALLVKVVQTIQKLEGDFPDTKNFLKDPTSAIREMTIDFDLALPGHSHFKNIYAQQLACAECVDCDQHEISELEAGRHPDALTDEERTFMLKTLVERVADADIEYAALEAALHALKEKYPITALSFLETTELTVFDQYFDLIFSGYSELKNAYNTQRQLLDQYNQARKAVTAHPQFTFNMKRLIELDQKIEVLVKCYPIAAIFLVPCDEHLTVDEIDAVIPGYARLYEVKFQFKDDNQSHQTVIDLEKQYPLAAAYMRKDAGKRIVFIFDSEAERIENPVYFPLDADYLFSNEGVTP